MAQPSQPISEFEKNKQRPLWRNRDYLLLTGGQAVSVVGSQLSLVSFPLLALFISGSPAQAGLVGAVRLLPYLLLSLPAGALADRWDRKRVMQICDFGRALALGSIPAAIALGHLTLIQLYLVSLIEGTLYVFFDLAEVACLPNVVAREQIVAATAQNQIALNVAVLLGPALGGLLYGLGRFLPFLFDACSYLASVVSLLWIRTKLQQERSSKPEKLLVEIRAGLHWIWHQPLILFIASTGTLFHLLFDGYVLIVIALAQGIHATPFAIGLVLAMDGTGYIIGSLITERVNKYLRFRAIAIATYWIWALLWLALLLVHSMLMVGIILALIVTVLAIYDNTQFSYRRMLIPDQLQGRVNSVFRMISYSGGPLGLALAGLLLQFWGPSITIAVLSAGVVALALLVTLNPYMKRPYIDKL